MVQNDGILERAHARAQRRLRAMVEAKAYPDPQAPETRLYQQSERLVDAILTELQWEAQKAEFDAMQAADMDERTDDYWSMVETEAELRAAWGDR